MKTELLVLSGFVLLLTAAFLMSFDPIERSKQAKDRVLKEDAILVLDAIADYFSAKARMPWFDDFGSNNPSPALPWTPISSSEVGVCSAKGCLFGGGDLIKEGVLSYGFNNRDSVDDNRVWVGKGEGAKDPVWACFVPKAKKLRAAEGELYKIDLDSPPPSTPDLCNEADWEEEVCFICIKQIKN